MARILYTKPSITEREIAYATDAVTTGWGERCYDYLIRFEQEFGRRIGAEHCIATSSATGALHLGLAALGIGAGDEVILGDINWIASAAPIVHLGATPIFVDVLEDSWCIDPRSVENAITPHTKAIMAVHLYGNLCDMNALLTIGQRHGIPVVEDAAEAIGSVYHGRNAGTLGAFSAFSFHGTKTITTGEGGMFATRDPELFARVLTLSNHGRRRDQARQFWADEIGFKYKMSNVQAAIGCGQLERWDELVSRKREVFAWYAEELDGLPLALNPEPPGTRNGYWMPTMVVNGSVPFDRARLVARFRAADIDARLFFWPLSTLPMFKGWPENRTSYGLYGRALNLPSYHDLTREDVARVAAVVRQDFAEVGPAAEPWRVAAGGAR